MLTFAKIFELRLIIIFSVLYFCTLDAYSQRGWEVGAGLGFAWYFGDLNPNFDLGHPGPAASILGRYNFNDRIAARFSLSYGLIDGDDTRSDNNFQLARNLSFRSNVWDATTQLEFNFFRFVHGHRDFFFSPYVSAGLGVFHFNPKAKLDGTWHELRPLGTEGQRRGQEYYAIQPAIVYGGGLKFSVSYRWSINVEINARLLFTDYLDDVSTTYPDRNQLRQQRGDLAVALSDRSVEVNGDFQIGEPGRQRGDASRNDSYAFGIISLNYYFGRLDCPRISRPDLLYRR
ncbi:MAG: hypothetical protein EA409_08030 [Saprospirales bacterium]|nr:MAG: hypothetical protein EA409_08030 [Saprospirales bacterium]